MSKTFSPDRARIILYVNNGTEFWRRTTKFTNNSARYTFTYAILLERINMFHTGKNINLLSDVDKIFSPGGERLLEYQA